LLLLLLLLLGDLLGAFLERYGGLLLLLLLSAVAVLCCLVSSCCCCPLGHCLGAAASLAQTATAAALHCCSDVLLNISVKRILQLLQAWHVC
jgi:hypothetical protein